MGFFPIGFLGCYGVYLVIHFLLGPAPSWLFALRDLPAAVVPLGFLGWFFLRARRERHTTLASMRVTFTDKGLSFVDRHGQSFSDAWSDYSGFYVGRRVVLLPKVEAPVSARIPLDHMPGARLVEIRGWLSGHLAELSKRDLLASVRAAKRRAG
jgi:hypothetical protein